MEGESNIVKEMLVVFIVIFVQTQVTVKGDEVLLNTLQFNGITYINTSTPNADNHWRIAGEKLKSCPPSTTSVADSYYVLPYASTSPAKEVVIDVHYTLRCCNSAQQYKLGIGLHALLASASSLPPPNPMTHAFRHVAELTNTTYIQPLFSKEFSSRSTVALGGKSFLCIAFRDQGFCGTIDTVEIKYFKCPAVVRNLTTYPEVAAPNSSSQEIEVNGICAHYSYPKTTQADNKMICYANGTSRVTGGCQCMAGYEKSSVSTCSACPPKTFKSSGGNFKCKKCGANVVDGRSPRTTICQCKAGFYKPLALLNVYYVDCEEPPSEPINVTLESVNSTWATVKWKEPRTPGTGDRVEYLVHYGTTQLKTAELGIKLTGMLPLKWYNVSITSVNNVTNATRKSKSATISFKTLPGVPSSVRDLSYTRNYDHSVTVHWKEPLIKGGDDLSYAVTVNNELKLPFIKTTNYTIHQMNNKMDYIVSVSSHTKSGSSKHQEVKFSIQGKDPGTKGPSSGTPGPLSSTKNPFNDTQNSTINVPSNRKDYGPIVAVAVSALSVLAAIGLLYIFCKRRTKARDNVGREVDVELVPVSSQESRRPPHVPVMEDNGNYLEPIRGRVNSNYDGNDEELHIPKEYVQTGAVLHKGKDFDIYFGKLSIPNRQKEDIAVKTFENNTFNKDLAKKLKEWNHQNIISFKGIVLRDPFVEAVFEFALRGRLDKYLQTKGQELSTLNLLEMAQGVADGMAYLSRKGFIHKHLKAENILVSRDNICKIYGFNLEQQEKEANYFWTSPEALRGLALTSKSDVWSYGVLLWEIVSYGKKPDAKQVSQGQNASGLKRPENCSEAIYELMKKCWEYAVGQRPTFTQINQSLIKEIKLRKEDRTGIYESIQ